MKNTTLIGIIVLMATLLALSSSAAVEEKDCRNATEIRTCINICTDIENCTMYMECVRNCTQNLTSELAEIYDE